MSYKDKLIELLCTNDRVREDIMEIKFGSILNKNGYGNNIFKIIDINYSNEYVVWEDKEDRYERVSIGDLDLKGYKIIGSPLSEHHLRMYCEDKGYTFQLINDTIGIYQEEGSPNLDNLFIVELDNTKDFDNQTEELYKAIVEFLIDNK